MMESPSAYDLNISVAPPWPTSHPLWSNLYHSILNLTNKSTSDAHSGKDGWTFSDGLACWYNRVFVQDVDSLCERILRECHDSVLTGHAGRAKTLELIQGATRRLLVADNHQRLSLVCQRMCNLPVYKAATTEACGAPLPNEVPDGYWQIVSCITPEGIIERLGV